MGSLKKNSQDSLQPGNILLSTIRQNPTKLDNTQHFPKNFKFLGKKIGCVEFCLQTILGVVGFVGVCVFVGTHNSRGQKSVVGICRDLTGFVVIFGFCWNLYLPKAKKSVVGICQNLSGFVGTCTSREPKKCGQDLFGFVIAGAS